MVSFDYVKNYDASDKTVPFSFEHIFHGVTFFLKPFEASFNIQLKQVGLKLSEEKGIHFTEIFENMDVTKPEHREAVVLLLSEALIAGWEGLKDDQGNIVEYSMEAAKKLIEVLPGYAINKIILFTLDISHFIHDPLVVGETVKN